MFRSSQNAKTTQPEQAQIGAGIRITGRIDSDGQLVLAGQLDGDIKAEAISITATGSVTGELHAQQVVIAGHVSGDVYAEHLLIASTAHVKGALRYQKIEIETGAQVEGEFKITEPEAAVLPVLKDDSNTSEKE